ncbi:MAG: chorismate mutase [Alphaproteobacteria bacterium]|nr:chorismate mutase [Alphaproteobacteria bacterium]
MSQQSLEEIRRALDDIDDRIHDLIMRRADIVAEVAARKGPGLPIRPAREAQMMRRLAKRHESAFPFSSLARIWHEMIAAFTLLQARYRIAVFCDEEYTAIWDLARDQYGSQTPMAAYGGRREALMQVMSGDADLAVLPPPEEDEAEPWWTALAVAGAPVIVQSLPFGGVGNVRGAAMRAVGVASLELQDTGDDISLIVLRTDEPVSRGALVAGLQAAGLRAALIAAVEEAGEWLHLARVEEFVAEDDARLAKCLGARVAASAKVIGCYARPLVDDPGLKARTV